jgi:hypothetical protein
VVPDPAAVTAREQLLRAAEHARPARVGHRMLAWQAAAAASYINGATAE